MDEPLIFESESYKIRGAAFEVYRQIGSGFLESVYQDCLKREFILRNIPFEEQKRLQLYYKDQLIDPVFVADFVCYGKIIIELKAVSQILPIHKLQVLNYLKMTQFELGLLINFGHQPLATVDRILNIQDEHPYDHN